ncbi:MAG TPA: hypothetical protein PK694_06245, partial [Rhodospirillales bacterium]|nr:hypothetical protein [Rhodospirillales bacterium]
MISHFAAMPKPSMSGQSSSAMPVSWAKVVSSPVVPRSRSATIGTTTTRGSESSDMVSSIAPSWAATSGMPGRRAGAAGTSL